MADETNRTSPPSASTNTRRKRSQSVAFLNPHIKKNLVSMLLYLVCGLAISELSAVLLLKTPVGDFLLAHLLVTVVATALLMAANILYFRGTVSRQSWVKGVCWATHCVLAGVPLILLETEILLKANVLTALLAVILMLKATVVNESIIEYFMPNLDMLQTLVLLLSAYYISFGRLTDSFSYVVKMVALHGGFVVYSGLLICDAFFIRKSVTLQGFDAMIFSMLLHIDILNLFFRSAVFISVK